MSLSVNVYIISETGDWIDQAPEFDYQTLAGFESYRTKLYGSEAAKQLGLVILPKLATQDLNISGEEVAQLQAEAELILQDVEKFAEQTDLDAEYIQSRVGNIVLACKIAINAHGNVVIW